MSSSYRMLLAWYSAVLFWRLEDIEGITAILACIESLLKLFLSLRLLHLKGQGVHSILFFSFFPSHAMSFFYLCTVGVARQLRRTSTWSHWTRKSTSRSWRRTTTALEKAWGLCWRGRFLSSINPSSGLGWRTGKQTRQYCLHKRHWSEKKKKKTHINDLFITLYDCWNQREVRTNGIEQRSIHTVRVTSANIDSWTRGTVHRSSVEPMPRPICINASLKAEPGASCSTAEGWARCFSPL